MLRSVYGSEHCIELIQMTVMGGAATDQLFRSNAALLSGPSIGPVAPDVGAARGPRGSPRVPCCSMIRLGRLCTEWSTAVGMLFQGLARCALRLSCLRARIGCPGDRHVLRRGARGGQVIRKAAGEHGL